MTTPIQVAPVRLLVACLFAPGAPLDEARAALQAAYGEVEEESRDWAFDVTDYYRAEMGPGLSRRFWSFETLVQPESIVHVKHYAATVEDRLRAGGHRRVNLDPLYLDHHKIVLASFKEAGHKIHLGLGVWADPTMRFHKARWQPFEWTFPDFRDGRYDAFLSGVRRRYLRCRRASSA